MAEDSENICEEAPDPDTTCSICYAEFLEPEDLKLHISQVHVTEYSKQCHFCDATYPDVDKYAVHIRDEHITNLKCCEYCSKVFTTFVQLKKHEIKHQPRVKQSVYSCSQCKRVFNNIFDLEQHELAKHNNDKDGIFLYDYYPALSAALNIKAPTFLHSLCTNTVYICVKCQHTTPNVTDYIEHLQTNNCQPVVCDKCSNVYQDRKGLLKHVISSKTCQHFWNEREKRKDCPKCKKTFDTRLLTEHVKYCKPITCGVCGVPFTSVQELSEHQSKHHPLAISLTACQFCRREFVGTVALEKHINRTHKSDFHLYKYMCVYCERTYFKHPKDLFGHFFSKHPDIHPYSCKICDKTFRIRKKFTIHIKLSHKSIGFVEFDDKYHVFFTEQKSENPFQPKSLFGDKTDDGDETEDQTEAENIEQTDKETDVEANTRQSETERKPFKLRFKEQNRADSNLLNSDFMTATETEGNQTENEVSLLSKRKRKLRTANKKPVKKLKTVASETENEVLTEAQQQSSEDEPLVNIKKKLRSSNHRQKVLWNKKKRKINRSEKANRNQFTCNICQKYCYTFQNYNHHMSLHAKNEIKKCIKCSKEFRTKTALEKHIDTQHKSSKLTETLKNLLERRKSGGNHTPQLTMAEKFQKTIKKVTSKPAFVSTAKLTELKEKLSVQKFIEEFTPETNETNKKENFIEVTAMVSIKTVQNPVKRPAVIKMKKFIPKQEDPVVRLAMPVRYKQIATETHKVNVRLVQKPIISLSTHENEETEQNNEYEDSYPDESYNTYEEEIENTEDKNEAVPDIAQEVLLGDTEEPKNIPTQIPHKIVIPKLPKEYKQIRIAHLLPQAPFFKIVKVDEVLKNSKKKGPTEEEKEEENEDIKLPPGTKLINVNPLAHLLGDTPVEKVIGTPKKSYYKPKTSNFQKAIAKALLQLENPTPHTKKKTSKKQSLQVEQ